MTGPAAQGARIEWAQVPAAVRAAIEDVCGAAVVRARTQPGGFSPGLAARVRCSSGARYFVKAVSGQANPDTPGLHRQEAHVLAALEPLITTRQLPIPRLYGTVDRPPWIALVLQDIDGRQPQLPWRTEELRQVVAALDQLADALTPAPVPIPAVGERLGAEFTGWRTLATSPGRDHLDPWSRAHLDELAELEATWAGHAAGDTLLHADIRADNILLTGQGAMVVDWPLGLPGSGVHRPGPIRAQRRRPRRPAARRADRLVTVWRRGQPARRDGTGLRPGRLSHRNLAAATTPWPADNPRFPGRARHHRTPLADRTPLALTARPGNKHTPRNTES